MELNFGDMMKNVQAMTSKMQESQEEIKRKVVEGESGGGMIKVRMNGVGELLGLEIDRDAIDPDDPELLADLIIAAVNSTRKKTEDLKLDGIKNMTGGIDLSQFGIDPAAFS